MSSLGHSEAMTYLGEHLPHVAGVAPVRNVENFRRFLWKIASTTMVEREGRERYGPSETHAGADTSAFKCAFWCFLPRPRYWDDRTALGDSKSLLGFKYGFKMGKNECVSLKNFSFSSCGMAAGQGGGRDSCCSGEHRIAAYLSR